MNEKINGIIKQLCFLEDEISEEMNLAEDLGFDSLNLVELIVKLEDDLGIEFDENDLDPDTIVLVGDIYRLTEKYTEKKGEKNVI